MAPSPSATELVIAIEQAAQESMLSEVELRCGNVLRRVANTFEQVVDDEERCVLAEQIGQKPVLTALGKLLSKLTTLSNEEDSLLYVTSFVSNSCLVYSERACDLTSMALIDALFQVLNGMHDSDVRQLAAAALTSLDANGRLHSDASAQDKLVMFARGLKLHMSKSNKTGYKNVLRIGEEYVIQFSAEGKKQRIGGFTSALSAAAAYAKLQRELATDSEGLPAPADSSRDEATDKPSDSKLHDATPRDRRGMATARESLKLHMSKSNKTGYKNVFRIGEEFVIQFSAEGKKQRIGGFTSALSAATAYAKLQRELATDSEGLPAPADSSRDEATDKPSDSKLHDATPRGMVTARENEAPAESARSLALQEGPKRFVAAERKRLAECTVDREPVCGHHLLMSCHDERSKSQPCIPMVEQDSAANAACQSANGEEPGEVVMPSEHTKRGLGHHGCEESPAEVDGLKLHMSKSNKTGYKNVLRIGEEYVIQFSAEGKKQRIGGFTSALSAATAYAKLQRELATDSEGLKLHMSKSNKTGYKNVFRIGEEYVIQFSAEGKKQRIGGFTSALSAAAAYAKLQRELATDSEGLPAPADSSRDEATDKPSDSKLHDATPRDRRGMMEALLSMRTKFKDMQQQSGSPSKLRKICLTETTMSSADEKDESYSSISRMSTAAKPSLAGSWHAEVDDCELNFDDGYENDNETSSKNSNTVGGTDHRRGLALSVSNVSTLGKEQCFIPVDIDHDKMALLKTIRTAIGCCSSKIRNAKELSASTAISMALSEMEKQFVQLKQHVQQVQHVLPKAATNLVAEYKSLKHGLCQLSEKAEILKAVESRNQANVNTEACNLKRKRVAMEEFNQHNRQLVEDQLQAIAPY
ncbi:hypothetical protein AB1Y20_000893 [Prymnesium parvum]|uniref:AP2/ERF domain-containing protein n=1 Tax=Prymnesium parvum TaxID=97485 RepID=A0AB34KB24_PRYPA